MCVQVGGRVSGGGKISLLGARRMAPCVTCGAAGAAELGRSAGGQQVGGRLVGHPTTGALKHELQRARSNTCQGFMPTRLALRSRTAASAHCAPPLAALDTHPTPAPCLGKHRVAGFVAEGGAGAGHAIAHNQGRRREG